MRKVFLFLSFLVVLEASQVEVAQAQQRFYFIRLVTMPYSPTVNAGWNLTSGNTYVLMMPNKNYGILQANGVIGPSGSSGAAPKKLLIQTYMTQPLQAQTLLSGSTITMQVRLQSNGTAGVTTHTGFMYARVMNEDGTIAAEIGNVGSGGGVIGTSATNRSFTLTLGGNVTIPANGRIVIEIGTNFSAGSATNITSSLQSVFSIAISDLPVDNTTTTSLDPWIEFSQTLLFSRGVTL